MKRIKMEMPRARLREPLPTPTRSTPRVRMKEVDPPTAKEPRRRRTTSVLSSLPPRRYSTRVRKFTDQESAVREAAAAKVRLDIVAQSPVRSRAAELLTRVKDRYPELWVIPCHDGIWIICETVARDF